MRGVENETPHRNAHAARHAAGLKVGEVLDPLIERFLGGQGFGPHKKFTFFCCCHVSYSCIYPSVTRFTRTCLARPSTCSSNRAYTSASGMTRCNTGSIAGLQLRT